MNQYSIFTFCVVTSDVISAKYSDIHRLTWECRDEFFMISNTNLNIKMVCKCSNFAVCVYTIHDNSKNNGSIHFILEHIVVYENSSDEFDIGHCLIKVKVTA